jgi:hypothetical protein
MIAQGAISACRVLGYIQNVLLNFNFLVVPQTRFSIKKTGKEHSVLKPKF